MTSNLSDHNVTLLADNFHGSQVHSNDLLKKKKKRFLIESWLLLAMFHSFLKESGGLLAY